MVTRKLYSRILIFLLSLSHGLHTNMLMDMGIMMGGQMGASIANQTISAMYQNMSQSMTKEQSNLQNSMGAFQSYVQKAQKKELLGILQFFKTAQTHMFSLTAAQSVIMQQMETYILQAVSLNQPQSHYMSNGSLIDQFFTLGTMYTPDGHIWKNVFPVGNWQYDETTDSFWQMTNQPLLTPETNSTTHVTAPTAHKAPNNAIFTEWISRKPSYEILCELTLYQVSYPFFVGVIFNKARWISGEMDRLQQYRLFGLYGDSNKKIQACYGEQYMPSKPSKQIATPTTTPQPLYPLQQIISGVGAQPFTINQTVFANLQQQPVTFKIKIITSPETIKCKIWHATATEPQAFVTIKSHDVNLYLYHGFGFMAPGAIAQFKIMKPTGLLFPTSAQRIFTTQVAAFLKTGVAS